MLGREDDRKRSRNGGEVLCRFRRKRSSLAWLAFFPFICVRCARALIFSYGEGILDVGRRDGVLAFHSAKRYSNLYRFNRAYREIISLNKSSLDVIRY